MKSYRTFSVLFPSVIAAASLAGDLRAAVTFTIQDAGPALNSSTPPTILAPATGTVSSTIAAANVTPQITYTVTGLDFESIGGTASEQVVFTVGFSATGGNVTYNANGNIYVGPNGDANQIDVGEMLTATVNLSSTTFAGGLSNLSIGFTQVQVTAWASGDAFKVTYSTGNTTITNPTSATYTLPAISNFFTVETTAGSLNLQRYNVEITAVPEPSAALLGGFGILALLRRRR